MADDSPEVAPESGAPPAPKRRRRWKWPAILLGIFVVLPVAAFAIWSAIALTYSYSDGDRTGFVQKFSKKGWVCKTWEGELSMVTLPGQAQERWAFSVRDDSIAGVIRAHMGNRMTLEYEEHRGVPTDCFAETSYFVVGVRPVAGP